jgi:hypothetical protein
MGAQGKLLAGLEFRGGLDNAAIEFAEFNGDLAVRGFHSGEFTLQFAALSQMAPDTEGTGFA